MANNNETLNRNKKNGELLTNLFHHGVELSDHNSDYLAHTTNSDYLAHTEPLCKRLRILKISDMFSVAL